jgi:hypothetical protein
MQRRSPIQKFLDANERAADLAHRCDGLRGQRDFARRVAGAGRLTAAALGATLIFLSGCASPEGVVTHDTGGSVAAYSARYHDMDRRGVMVRIEGLCGSACTLALRSRNMCYRPDARFVFHGVSNRNGYDARASEAFKAAMPEDVRRWAEATGAFNSTDTVSISGADMAAIDGRLCA